MLASNLRATSIKVTIVIFLCLISSLNVKSLSRTQRQTDGLNYDLANTNIDLRSYPALGNVNPIDFYNSQQYQNSEYPNYNRFDNRNFYGRGDGYSGEGSGQNYGYGYGYGAGRWRGFGKHSNGPRVFHMQQPQYGVKY